MANRIPPPREFSWARTLRTLSFWALLIVGSIALVQFAANRRPETVDISYTQFTEQLDKGNVDTVEITERQQVRSEEHTSELQSPCNLVCRLLLEKKKKTQ